jgi:hypothetical protein
MAITGIGYSREFHKQLFSSLLSFLIDDRRKQETIDMILLLIIFLKPTLKPVRIRIRIDSPHPLVCRYRTRRLNGAVLRMRPEKPRPRVTAGVVR